MVATMFTVGCTDHDDEDSGAASRKRCLRLRDHLVELRLATASVDVAAHRDILRRSLGEQFMTECSKLSPKQVKCALEAKESAEAMACSR